MKHVTWGALLAVILIAAAAGTALAAQSSSRPVKRHPVELTTLQHHLAILQAQNAQLRSTSPAGIAAQLARTREALTEYTFTDAAKAAGYVAASPCESTPTDRDQTSYGGAMGFHYVNAAYEKPGPVDPAKPPVLVYAPNEQGQLQLVAAEYFKPDADQNVKTDSDRPTLFGRAFDGPMLGHAPGMPIHYDLHVWLFKHNPSGLFAPWNPDVTCPK